MENIEKTFQNILLAEQEAKKIVEKAEQDSAVFMQKANVKADSLRDKTLEKLRSEQQKLEIAFLDEKQKIVDDILGSAKADISLLDKKSKNEKDKIAEEIVREILDEWQ